MGSLLREEEVAVLAQRYGQPRRWRCVLEMGARSFRYWQEEALPRRRGEVVLLIHRPNGWIILHTKGFYPPTTYRLISGGIHLDETVESAVHREAREETGLRVEIERFLGLVEYEFRCGRRRLSFVSYVFAVREVDGRLAPQDKGEQIAAYREVPVGELLAVAEALENIEENWRDWGRFRAVAHRLAAEALAS